MTSTPSDGAAGADGREIFTITPEPLTPEAFERFGTIIGVREEYRLPIKNYSGLQSYRPGPLLADTEVEWLVARIGFREPNLRFLERHAKLAQAFIPLGGVGFVSVLAPPDAELVDGVPAFEEIRAFRVPGNLGIQIHQNTWHEPPFSAGEPLDAVITSHRTLTEALGSQLDERQEIARAPEDVDKRNITERTGRVIRIAL